MLVLYKISFLGIISVRPGDLQSDLNPESVFQTFPEWKMVVNVEKDFLLSYGPWADRQR